jgi:hypothetical protein
MKKLIVMLILAGMLLGSCMGVESKIKLNPDGSGKINFTYRISQMLLNMGKGAEGVEGSEEAEGEPAEGGDSEGGESNIPLPMTKEDFEKQIEGVEGLRVLNVSQEENEKDLIISAELEFDNVENLNQSETFSEWTISYTKEGGTCVYKQLISEGNTEPADEETISMIESMFAGYELVFSVEVPKPIKEYNRGELSPDKKSVTYRIPISGMMALEERQELIVKW